MIAYADHLTQADLAAVECAELGKPPSVAEWEVYLRKIEHERDVLAAALRIVETYESKPFKRRSRGMEE